MTELRMAADIDTENILLFIKDHWRKDHIFVQWPDLFKYCHSAGQGAVNYALAIDSDNGDILGVCGYIQSNQTATPDVWVALWKALPSGNPTLGLELLEFVREKTNCRVFCCCGINQEVMKLYKFLGYQTGTLEHYYRLADRREYRIASIDAKVITPDSDGPDAALVRLETMDDLHRRFDPARYSYHKPYKDIAYLEWRYYQHISYQYQVYGIDKGYPSLDAILIMREVTANGAKALRIVDYIGLVEDLALISRGLGALLEKGGYEYIDFYQWGIPGDIVEAAGFVKREHDDSNIIPNYFEPFIMENADIHFFTNDLDGFTMFKADGDQDRPNARPAAEGLWQ